MIKVWCLHCEMAVSYTHLFFQKEYLKNGMRIIDKTHCKEVIILRYYDPRSEESLKNLTEGFVRKGGRKTLRVGRKVLKKSILMMVKAFGLPFVLIFGVIILVVAISSYALFGCLLYTSPQSWHTRNSSETNLRAETCGPSLSVYWGYVSASVYI